MTIADFWVNNKTKRPPESLCEERDQHMTEVIFLTTDGLKLIILFCLTSFYM